jgi:hypothetical protein
MAKVSLKRIRTFIEMHDMEQDIQVAEHDGPIKYVVIHKQFGPPWKMEYFCRTLTDAAGCVNRIIYKLPMEDNCTVIEKEQV